VRGGGVTRLGAWAWVVWALRAGLLVVHCCAFAPSTVEVWGVEMKGVLRRDEDLRGDDVVEIA